MSLSDGSLTIAINLTSGMILNTFSGNLGVSSFSRRSCPSGVHSGVLFIYLFLFFFYVGLFLFILLLPARCVMNMSIVHKVMVPHLPKPIIRTSGCNLQLSSLVSVSFLRFSDYSLFVHVSVFPLSFVYNKYKLGLKLATGSSTCDV